MNDGLNPAFVKGAPMPASMGLCADLYAEVRELRLAMAKIVEGVKDRESEIRDHIINNLSKSDDTGAAGKKYRAQIVVKDEPQMKSWDTFIEYVFTTGRTDMLYKRAVDKPIKDAWEAGETIPGVEKFPRVDVSITKI